MFYLFTYPSNCYSISSTLHQAQFLLQQIAQAQTFLLKLILDPMQPVKLESLLEAWSLKFPLKEWWG